MKILHALAHMDIGIVKKIYDKTNIRELFDDVREYCRKNPTSLGYEMNIPDYGLRYLRPEPRYWNSNSFT